MGLEVARTENGEDCLLRVSGEVDLDTSPRLLGELNSAIKSAQRIKVDLRGVDYIDSSGVAILIQGLKQAGKAGASFALVDPSPRVMSVLELA